MLTDHAKVDEVDDAALTARARSDAQVGRLHVAVQIAGLMQRAQRRHRLLSHAVRRARAEALSALLQIHLLLSVPRSLSGWVPFVAARRCSVRAAA